MRKAIIFILISCLSFTLASCATNQPGPVGDERAKLSSQQLAQALEYYKNQQIPEAKLAINESLVSNPGNAQAHHIAALIVQRSGETSQAKGHFETALELAPNDASIRNNYGNFLCSRGNYMAAERNFKLAANQASNNQPEIAHTNLGLCALRSGKDGAARTAFEQAVQLNPAQTTAIFQLARLNLEAGKPLAASTLMEQFSQHSQDTAKSLLLRARIEQSLGNPENMEQYKQRLMSEFPNSTEISDAKQLVGTASRQSNSIVAPASQSTGMNDTDWLLSRIPGHYTLQILATEDQTAIERLQRNSSLKASMRKFSFISEGKTWFNLIIGDYASLDTARRELQSLPDELKQYTPWIRRFDSIQRVVSLKGK